MAVGGRAAAAAGLLLAASTIAAGVAPAVPAVAAKGQGAGPRSVATGTEPLVGDFDGDRRGDILWYGSGAAGDLVWYGANGRFAPAAATMRGSYRPRSAASRALGAGSTPTSRSRR